MNLWTCLTCDEGGEYTHPDTKTDTSAPAKHNQHPTVTTTSPALIERLRGAA